ncbi:MAG: hypothetical protein NUV42_03060 [Candidatus Yonathbacteria bacterium]|nr:hypothetical protein [Candidatus Yonathbacteria bacterium]
MDQERKEWWKHLDPNKPKNPNRVSKGALRKAMRSKCLDDCCVGQEVEVRECPVEDCRLYPFRRGARSDEPGNKATKKAIWAAIREKCMNCSSYSWAEVARCTHDWCILYPYRFGKALAKVTERDIDGAQEIDTEDEDEDTAS